MTDHPDWLAPGSNVVVVRRSVGGRSVVHRRDGVVRRQTKTLVILVDGDRFKAVQHGFRSFHYAMAPPYLDYITTLEPADWTE